jgi:hypothetical protein
MRAALLLIFLVLWLGPFTHLNSSASPERWSSVKSSVASAWKWSAASITDTIKPLLTAALPDERSEPDAAEPASRTGGKRCTDAQAALSLCPKN